MSEFTCPKCGSVLTVAAKPQQPKKALSVEDVKKLFPIDLLELLNLEEREDYIIARPRRFLGSEDFAKIAHIIRTAKGEYISAGKESHFKIPKKE